MKKIFYFILAAVTVVLAACGGEENDPNLKNYKVKVLSTTENSIEVEITAVNKEKYFIFALPKSEVFLKNPESFMQNAADLVKLLYKGEWPNGVQHGSAKNTFDKLDKDTEYALCIAEVDQDYKVVGDVEYKLIKTAGVTTPPAAPIGVKLAYDVSSLYAVIAITWHSVEGATSYRVYRDPAYDVIRAEDGTIVFEERYKHVEETFFSEKMWLEYDHNYQYEYYVTAVKDGVESEPSEKVRFVSTPGL